MGFREVVIGMSKLASADEARARSFLFIFIVVLSVKVFAQDAQNQPAPEKRDVPTFQDWKSQRLHDASVALQNLQKKPVTAGAESSVPRESLTKRAEDGTKKSDSPRRDEPGTRFAQRAKLKPPVDEAREAVQRAQDLTVVDYLVAHLVRFREDPEAMKLAATRMTPQEVFEMMKAYLTLLHPAAKEGETPVNSLVSPSSPGLGETRAPR